jgi:transposase-like protein
MDAMDELDVNLNDLSKHFSDETSARQFLERLRWPHGPRCPHCGSEKAYRLAPTPGSKRPVRAGVCKCAQCRKQFTVTVGTIFEDSHIPLSRWLLAIHLLCASKRGMSAHQLHRMLGVTYKSAWFMAHRIRYAMTQPPLERLLGAGGVVEADETYIGGRTHGYQWRAEKQKVPVVALVERSGEARAMALDRVTGKNIRAILRKNVSPKTCLYTDESDIYTTAGARFADHQTVCHSKKEYVRGPVHTNTVEGFFSILKRGIHGVYHHVSQRHLPRYLDEFTFRYTNRSARGVEDGARAALAILGAKGKRLTYTKPTEKPTNQREGLTGP